MAAAAILKSGKLLVNWSLNVLTNLKGVAIPYFVKYRVQVSFAIKSIGMQGIEAL